ncbi:MAG: cobaltochelatase subunit CobN [Planctomycetes bacterium]|nr:cobaltochelatase subunit CobN [Planctomycetota bacterium]
MRSAALRRGGLILLLAVLFTSLFPSTSSAQAGGVSFVFFGVWDRARPMLERVGREQGVDLRFLPGRLEAAELDQALAGGGLWLALNVDPATANELALRLAAMPAATRPRLLALDERDSQSALRKAGLLEADDKLRAYWRANGLVNIRRLFVYLLVTRCGGSGEIKPPAAVPERGYRLPGAEEVLETLAELKAASAWDDAAPTAVLLIQRSFWITGDVKVIDAEAAALRREGMNVAILFSESTADLQGMMKEVAPDLVVEDRHGAIWEGARGQFLSELGVPYLRPISMLAYTLAEWRADPQGLAARDRNMFMALQELHGTVEPIVVGGLVASIQGFKLHEPEPERIAHFARRARRLVDLRRKPVAERKVALIHYSKSLGKGDVMRGSPTGAFLDAPTSTVIVLERMKQRGYAIDRLPADADQLMRWMMASGRNIGPWAQGELEELADSGRAVLVPLARFQSWLGSKLSAEARARLEQDFGPPPGSLMVVRRNGEPQIVLPVIRLGNVVLAPQPERGEKQDQKLLHSKTVPPPYNYLAFYWWLEEDFGADVISHFGTHGSLELLPGKEAGLAPGDWGDVCVGSMPVVNLWIMDNLGEASLSRRRSYATLVDHLPPPAQQAGMNADLRDLHEAIHKWRGLEAGLLRRKFLEELSGQARALGLLQALHLDLDAEGVILPTAVEALDDHLHAIEAEATPLDLHVIGRNLDEAILPAYLTRCLHRDFLEAVAALRPEDAGFAADRERAAIVRRRAEALVGRALFGDGEAPEGFGDRLDRGRRILEALRQTDREIEGFLDGLDGRFVAPGPGPDPIRNALCAPGGRNLFGLNPEEIPTRPSWEVAGILVDRLLADRRPEKVGIDLNGMNTMRDFGVMEGQILRLLGVRPVWDENELVIDVELIPRAELGRDRVDVFVALGGTYKENFPSRVKLIDKAIRLAAAAEDELNPLREHSREQERRLLAAGYSTELAAELRDARIFGVKPGDVTGTKILDLVPRSGVWESDTEISDVYVDTMSHVYTGSYQGRKFDGLYESAIEGTDTLLRVWASNMTSQLSNHHAYEYLGGLSMAVKAITGREPEAFIADLRDPNGARLRSFEEVLATNLQTELLNEAWIKGMKEHDYAGAGMMAELVKNTFGWDVTRSSAVPEEVWARIDEVYARDARELGLKDWFERVNPHARQEILATMIEAARKSYWHADDETLERLERDFADSVARHGLSAGLVTGGNEKLQDLVRARLDAPGDQALRSAYDQALAKSTGNKAEAGKEQVFGPALEREVEAERPAIAPPATGRRDLLLIGAVVLGLLFLVIGYRAKSGGLS